MPSRPAKAKKKNFSRMTPAEALKLLGLRKLQPWGIAARAIEPSAFFRQRLDRLQRTFDLTLYEKSRELLIDAVCEEAILPFENLRIWKGAPLETDQFSGQADYLVTDNKDYCEAPFLCVVEAKRDDFVKGMAQCLTEMKVCQMNNQNLGLNLDLYGIVTNGETWKFYRLTPDRAMESQSYSLTHAAELLGVLTQIFQSCSVMVQTLNTPADP